MALWDQLDNESNAAYARFLAYRNLGPGRTLQRAYESHKATLPAKKRNKTQLFTRQWGEDSTQFRWVERSTAWDVSNLLTQGERAATLYIAAIEKYTELLYQSLTSGNLSPDDFDSATKAFELLSKLLPGEAIGQIIAARSEERDRGGDS